MGHVFLSVIIESFGEDAEQLKPLYTTSRNERLYSWLGILSVSVKVEQSSTIEPNHSTLRYLSKGN